MREDVVPIHQSSRLMNPHFTQLSIAMHLAQQIDCNYPLLSQPIGKWLGLGFIFTEKMTSLSQHKLSLGALDFSHEDLSNTRSYDEVLRTST